MDPDTTAVEANKASPWRRHFALAGLAYLGLACASLLGWLTWAQRGLSVGSAITCALPLLLLAWLVLRREPDDRQYAVQLLAAVGFTPVLLAFWASSEVADHGIAAWPLMVPAALLHTAVFVALVWWMGSASTRLEPAAGAVRVDAPTLMRRLASLPAAGVPCEPHATAAPDRLVYLVPAAGPDRCHRVTLQLEPAARQVRVGERLSALNARPVDAAEASMRQVGEPVLDAARPDVLSISGVTWQTTVIDPQRLAALQPLLRDDGIQLPPDQAATLDGEGAVTLMCAVVTRSGWAWQPGWKV